MSDLSGTPTSLGIGTYNTSIDPPSGLGFNEAMGQIDALIAGRVLKPSGIASGEVPVWNGTAFVRSSSTPLVAGLTNVTASNGSGALQDLPSPTTLSHYHSFYTAGGGSLRSIGVPPVAGARISVRNGSGGNVTMKNQTAGGTGAQLVMRNFGDITLANSESIDFLFDGSLWTEQSRDQTTASTVTTVGTSLPGSPADGDQYVLVDSTSAPTYAWLLQYSSAASEWIFIGGTPLANYSTSASFPSNTNPGASYVDYTGQPTVTVPRAGKYIVEHGAGVWCNASTITVQVSVKNGSNTATDADSVMVQNIPVSNGAVTVSKTTPMTVAASAVLKQQWKATGNAGINTSAWIKVTPVAVT